MYDIIAAQSPAHFEQILILQSRYHFQTLSDLEQASEGFVFARHSLPLLQRMATILPQAIALFENQVVAYCLSMHPSMSQEIPSLIPMFEQFSRCDYQGRPLSEFRYFVGGQVCVDRAHRGKKMLSKLYQHLRDTVADDFDLCVTEIAARNVVSIRAHQQMGFEIIDTYRDAAEEWVIVAWDFRPT